MDQQHFPVASLGSFDYVVFIGMLLISVGIGIYYKFTGGQQRSTSEYLMADHSMGVWPVAFSLMASFASAITLLGLSSEIYTYGTQFMAINIAYVIGTPISAFVFLPVFYRLKLTSIYEYLEQRYNRSIRILASATFMAQMIFYIAIVLYAPALAFSAVTGISKWVSIISVGTVCTLYCTLGGIKAVIWTDVFQSLLMFFAMFIIIVKGTIDVGGVHEVYRRANLGSRLEFTNFDMNPTTRHTIWNLVIGGTFMFISVYGVNQTQVQRLLTVRTLRQSQMALFISWILVSLLSFTTAATGLVIYANFWKADPLKCGIIKKSDQLLPYYAVSQLAEYPGLPGMIIAGIFSGSLSTVSSFVNSFSAVTLEDYIKPILMKRGRTITISEVFITKLLVFFYGCLFVMLTYLVDKMAGLLQASLTVFGVIGGPLLMLFIVGICFSRTNAIGAMTGFIVSLFIGLWIGFGSLLYGKKPIPLETSNQLCTNMTVFPNLSIESEWSHSSIYDLSYMWFAALSCTIGIIVTIVISWCANNQHELNVKPKLDKLLMVKLLVNDRQQNPTIQIDDNDDCKTKATN